MVLPQPAGLRPAFDVIVVVASTGGLEALKAVLTALPPDLPVPVVVLQHRSAAAPDLLTPILARAARIPVRAAGPVVDLTVPGVTVLPAEHSLRLTGGTGELAPAGRGGGGDALLTGLGQVYGPRGLGVVLTGRLDDGAAGVRALKRAGGRVLVQDPADAVAPGMPSAAIVTGCVDHVLPLRLIGPALVALTLAPGCADYLSVPLPSWARVSPAPGMRSSLAG